MKKYVVITSYRIDKKMKDFLVKNGGGSMNSKVGQFVSDMDDSEIKKKIDEISENSIIVVAPEKVI